MVLVHNRVHLEIGQGQCGFIEGTATGNVIFMLRILERVIQVQKTCTCDFIDYANAFHKVGQKELLEVLGNLYICEKDIKIIQNLY